VTSISSAAADVFAGGGDMGALMRSLDWSRTTLGPVEGWPQSLKTSVSIGLATRFPILVFWGPDLIMLDNDSCLPIWGEKHPGAMGSPGHEVWAEIRDILGPMLLSVQQRGDGTWSEDQMLPVLRKGFLEEVFFTSSYSPIGDESGGVGGIFTALMETTERVVGARDARTQAHRLAAAAAITKPFELDDALTTVSRVCRRAH
jgi:hypothetical protein